MKQKQRTHTKKFYLGLLAILAVFVFIVSFSYGRMIWFDESYTAHLVTGNFKDIAEMAAVDVHPPLYYMLLRVWSLIFGRSLVALRAFSTFSACLALVFLAKLFYRWSKSENVSLFLTACVAACPFFMYYAGEMRMYALSCAIVFSATLLLDYALKEKKRKYWVFYGLLLAAGILTHYFIALAFFAHFIYIIYYFRENKLDKNFFISYPLALVLILPWLPTLIRQATGVTNGFWIEPFSIEKVLHFFSLSMIYFEDILEEIVQRRVFFAAVLMVVLTFFAARKQLGNTTKKRVLELLLIVFVPPLTLAFFSIPPRQSLYVERYIVYSLSLLWAVIGVFILAARKEHGVIARLTIAAMLVCTGFGIHNVLKINDNTSVFKDISDYVAMVDKGDTPIVYRGYDSGAYDQIFYETKNHHVYATKFSEDWGAILPVVRYKEHYIDDYEGFLEKTDKFWLVTGSGRRKSDVKKNLVGDGFEITDSFASRDYAVYLFVKTEKSLK